MSEPGPAAVAPPTAQNGPTGCGSVIHGWQNLVVLAERERDLVRDERWDEVPAAAAALLSASEALGDPPAEARPHLERLAELQGEIHAGLSAGRAFTLNKLGKMERGATAMRGYGYTAPATPSVDGRA